MKRDAGVRVRLTDEERAALESAARAANTTLSEYMRRNAVVTRTSDPVVSRSPETLKSYHVDDLGPDSLRSDNGALSR